MLSTETGQLVSRTDVLSEYGCPLCGAVSGESCVRWNRSDRTFTGPVRASLHMERWQQYPGVTTQSKRR